MLNRTESFPCYVRRIAAELVAAADRAETAPVADDPFTTDEFERLMVAYRTARLFTDGQERYAAVCQYCRRALAARTETAELPPADNVIFLAAGTTHVRARFAPGGKVLHDFAFDTSQGSDFAITHLRDLYDTVIATARAGTTAKAEVTS